MKILLVGAGGVGGAFTAIAARRDFFEQIVIADYDVEKAEKAAAVDDRFVAARIDASDAGSVTALCREHGITHVMNAVDPVFNEAARVFAARLLREAKDDPARIDLAYRLALSRSAKDAEKAGLLRLLDSQRAYFKTNPADAAKVLAVGIAPRPAGDSAEQAAWTQVCRVVLNLHETITRH